jgi:putative toxin-antitoxin system antitoxin component (TIGR02293 family)
MKKPVVYKAFDPSASIKRARKSREGSKSAEPPTVEPNLMVQEPLLALDPLHKVEVIRKGLPYESIDVLSHRLNKPLSSILPLFDMPQTTYHKKKKAQLLMSRRDTESVLGIMQVYDYGLEVFNQEEDKFRRWLSKPNASLGGLSPESLFDSLSGLQEVKNCLSRIEYGNFA